MNCDVEFRNASFAGVEFEILPSSHSGGRRILTHEYPFMDDHYNEDLGDTPLKWSIKGAFVGENWRDRLADAKVKWRKSGAGEFFEPTENATFQAVLVEWEFDLDSAKLNYVEFSLDLVEKGLEPYLNLGESVAYVANTALQRYFDGVEESYVFRFDLYTDIAEALRAYESARGYLRILTRQFMGIGSFLSVFSTVNDMDATRDAPTNFDRAANVFETAADSDRATAFYRMASEIRTPGEGENEGYMVALIALGYYFEAIAQEATYAEMAAFRDRAESLKLSYNDSKVSGLIDGLIIALGKAVKPLCRATLAGQHHALVASYELYGNVSNANVIMALSGGVSGSSLNGATYPC